jgi:cytochrome c peroxidase
MARIVYGSSVVLLLMFSAATVAPARSRLALPATPYRYADLDLPAHFAPPGRNDDNTPSDNPLTDHGATLGRVLFYDARLSVNNSTSCASCHVQARAFADPNPVSRGFRGAHTDRRAMPLVNVRFYQRARFLWDERAGSLEQMVLLPIENRIEMGQNLDRVVDALTRDPDYPALFARAFGDRQVTERRIGNALAQFVRALVSYRSRYDVGRARAESAGHDFDNFTVPENRGKALFMRKCSSCHMKDGNEHFSVQSPANTGLRGNDPAADGGVGDVTLRAADVGSFKSPSLRNVEVTAPYGHDGRFPTLEALIDHYSDNPIPDPNRRYATAPFRFTASEKAALIAFLKTLTDRTFLEDPRFSSPFVDRKADIGRGDRRGLLPAGGLLMVVDSAARAALRVRSATHVPEPPPLPPSPVATSSHPMIERLLSFDGDGDCRISQHELPERMHGLVARGDANADAALDGNEIRDLANAAFSWSCASSATAGLRGAMSQRTAFSASVEGGTMPLSLR